MSDNDLSLAVTNDNDLERQSTDDLALDTIVLPFENVSNDNDLERQPTDDLALDTIILPFECGKSFTTYSELEKVVKAYENTHFAVLVKVKSEKWPEGHKNRETLVYKTLVYACKKGQNRHKSEAKGIRPNVTSGKLGCRFKLKISSNRGALVVKEAALDHTGHELT
ncbi:hypothetical protein JTE90_021711 [Oedothorax gibbosus]|uniref:ZSWIM3 N-terminal domain-containing protein n=1 Tax=Oedothorax gibbosus TaxID=931172 RepID=A0AAV6TQY1_9ARAC|nr:hypothetical protein JTE90_021711 [Oedothorax gibbosus]